MIITLAGVQRVAAVERFIRGEAISGASFTKDGIFDFTRFCRYELRIANLSTAADATNLSLGGRIGGAAATNGIDSGGIDIDAAAAVSGVQSSGATTNNIGTAQEGTGDAGMISLELWNHGGTETGYKLTRHGRVSSGATDRQVRVRVGAFVVAIDGFVLATASSSFDAGTLYGWRWRK